MIDAKSAAKILARSLQPRRSEIEEHCKLASTKIKLAAKLKHDSTRYEVICEMMSVPQTSAIAMMVALEMKKRGFRVKIRDNELHLSWKNVE